MEDTYINIATAQWKDIVDKILRYREKEFNAMIEDMRTFSAQTVRSASIKDIEDLLKLFTAPTMSKKKEELIEFLRLMPGYMTHDKYLLQERIAKLIWHQNRTRGIRDPLLYAKLQNQPEQEEEIPSLNE